MTRKQAPRFQRFLSGVFSYSNLTYNPFYSQIHAPLDRTEEEKYININASLLIGLTPDKVFLRDINGSIVTLVPGSRVAYGYLNYIHWKQQCAVFNINRIGINQEVKCIYRVMNYEKIILLVLIFSLMTVTLFAQWVYDEFSYKELVSMTRDTPFPEAIKALDVMSIQFEGKKIINMSAFSGTIGIPVKEMYWKECSLSYY